MKRRILVFLFCLLLPAAAWGDDFDFLQDGISRPYTCLVRSGMAVIKKNSNYFGKHSSKAIECYTLLGPEDLYFLGLERSPYEALSLVGTMPLDNKGIPRFSAILDKDYHVETMHSQLLIYRPQKQEQPLIVVLAVYDFRFHAYHAGRYALDVIRAEPDGSMPITLHMDLGEWGDAAADSGEYKYSHPSIAEPAKVFIIMGFAVDFEPKDGYGDILLWKNNYISAKVGDEKFNFIKEGEEFLVMYYDKDSKTLKEPKKVKIDNSKELKRKLLWSKFAEFSHNHGFTLGE
ncbi:MAG: hypothetical protein OEV59_09110 [Deltaproteobacteria bacterium]|nr:hypothetical protein [Deltaproteobacteria bacterium]